MIKWIKSLFTSKKDPCTCGMYKTCIREIKTNSEGRMWVENHFECGKIQQFIRDNSNRRL